jgi:NADH-quinone oxidoreductase subunit I
MGIKKGNPDERKLAWHHKVHFIEVFKGMAYTFKMMFKPSVTVEYPEEKWTPNDEFRGRPVLVMEKDKERCVACGLCARSCPPLAISMQAAETDDDKERYPLTFEINMLRCIYCGYCEEVCPEEAIVMSKDYDFTFTNRKDAIFDKNKLLVKKEDLQSRLQFLEKKRNPIFGKIFKFLTGNNRHSWKDKAVKS